MKLLHLLILSAFMMTACGSKPQDLVTLWQEALNKGDVDTALSYLASDAMVTVISPLSEGDGNYNGHAEIRVLYETMVVARGVTRLSACTTEGEAVTCFDTYTDDRLKSISVDQIEGSWVAVVRDGKIQTYSFTISPESLAKFPPPPPTEVRVTTADIIIGKWQGKSGSHVILHDFRANGMLIVSVTGMYVVGKGQYWFEDDLLKMNEREGDCANMLGVYEVYATYKGDRPVKLRFVMVGEDACSTRRNTLAEGLLAIPPAPTPTAPAVSEMRITLVEKLLGTWRGQNGSYEVLHNFKTDGTLIVHVSGVGDIGSGPYQFEDDQLRFEDSSGDCEGIVAHYEVYGTYKSDQLTQLRYLLVGEDACVNRRKTLDGNTLVPNP